MDGKKDIGKVTAIVPAYNEAQRIGEVLEVLLSCKILDEVIVVDDGSTDNTEQIVRTFPVQYIRIFPNGGKGQAMEKGVELAQNDVVCFCDADIRGLEALMIEQMATPVLRGEVDMFVAMRNRKTFILRFLLAFIPLLGGERVLTKDLWNKVPKFYKTKFRIEAGLNFYAKYYGKGFRFKVFKGLTQTVKEKKYGFWRGFWARLKMMGDYLKAQIKLELTDIPNTVKNRRLFVVKIVSTLGFLLLGLFLLVALYFGPRHFLLKLFEKRLQTDPSTPVLDFFLSLAGTISIDILLAFALSIIIVNTFILFINISGIIRLFYNYVSKWRHSAFVQIQENKEEIIAEKKEVIS